MGKFASGFDSRRWTGGRKPDLRPKITRKLIEKHEQNHETIYDLFIQKCLDGEEKYLMKWMDTHFMRLPTEIDLDSGNNEAQEILKKVSPEVLKKYRDDLIREASIIEEENDD